MSRRSDLRAQVFEIAGNRCEHPAPMNPTGVWYIGRCLERTTELAHIQPRGMGHTGYRDRLDNVMAACPVHARSTDDLTSPEWDHVPGWRGREIDGTLAVPLMTKRQALAHYVNKRRQREGVDLERSDR